MIPGNGVFFLSVLFHVFTHRSTIAIPLIPLELDDKGAVAIRRTIRMAPTLRLSSACR
jgi:hypothetical protein